jgi:hypothetical protein
VAVPAPSDFLFYIRDPQNQDLGGHDGASFLSQRSIRTLQILLNEFYPPGQKMSHDMVIWPQMTLDDRAIQADLSKHDEGHVNMSSRYENKYLFICCLSGYTNLWVSNKVTSA